MSKTFLISIVLILMTLCVFAEVVYHDFFVIDDLSYVRDNPHLKQGITREAVEWAFSADLIYDSPHTDYWQPVTLLSRAVDVKLFGINPAGHHLINLLIHALNVLFLFTLLRNITGKLWPSAFVAAVFAIHPFQVETVAWVTARKDLLCAFFGFLTLWFYVDFTKRPGILRYFAVVFSFLLCLLSKPSLVALPFILLLLDFWPLERIQKTKTAKERAALLLEKTPLFIFSGIVLLVISKAPSTSFYEIPPVKILLRIPISYIWYFAKTILPLNLGLRSPDLANLSPAWQTASSLLLLLAISWTVLRQKTRRPYLAFGWLWFLATLSPAATLIPVGDRFMYVPIVGLAIMAAWGAPELVKAKRTIYILSASALCIFAVLTSRQTAKWRDSSTFLKHSIEVSPQNFLAHYNLGTALFRQGEYKKAIEHYGEVLTIAPDRAFVYDNIGLTLFRMERWNEAREAFEKALDLDPTFEVSRRHLNQLEEIKRTGLLEKSER